MITARVNVFWTIAFAAIASLIAPLASATPKMPQGFALSVTNATGKSWREIGVLPQPFAMARVTVKTAMLGQGYKLVHDVAENEYSPRRIQFWRRRDEDIIIMLWQEDLGNTGIAWGLSNRDESQFEGTSGERESNEKRR